MTVYEKAARLLGIEGDKMPPTLTELVFDVRMSTNGAADPMSKEQLGALFELFEMRLAEWHEPTDVIDECVRTMCKEAMRMIEVELSTRIADGWDY